MLTNEELDRYDRHLVLAEIGIANQLKLKQSKVLVIGAGGLGSPVLSYLTAAGIGCIGIVDNDIVSISNLQRQILYNSNQINKSKIEIAKQKLTDLNPNTKFKLYNTRFNKINGEEITRNFDLVIDCTDNFSARYDIDYVCEKQRKPMIYGSISKFKGQLSVFHYNKAKSYKDLFAEAPSVDVNEKSRLGVIGVLPGIIGSLQANKAIKIITGIGNVLAGKLLLIDVLKMSFVTIDI